MIFYDRGGEREYASTMHIILVICFYSSTVQVEAWSLDQVQSEGHTPIDYIKGKVKNEYMKCLKVYLSSNEGVMVEIMSWYPPEKKES